MQTIDEKTGVSAAARIRERIATLDQRSKELEVFLKETQGEIQAVSSERRRVIDEALRRNDKKNVLSGIAVRSLYDLFRDRVTRRDSDTALAEISANKKALAQLCRLKEIGAGMTIISVDASEVLLIDTAENVDVKAQEKFLLGLNEKERSDAESALRKRFPKIDYYLERADTDSGVSYYDCLLLCEVTGAELMPEDEYRKLQKLKSVDCETCCSLLTKQEMLDRGVALRGQRIGDEVCVIEDSATSHDYFRAGRFLLRVQRP